MLEFNFTELDNDFITLWSKWILTHDYNLIKNNLEKLAELGQVNAVQSYYLFLDKNEIPNTIIDDIVDDLRGENFNFILAKAHKSGFYEKGYSDLIKQKEYLLRNGYYDDELEALNIQIERTQTWQLRDRAARNCLVQYNNSKNPLVLERFGEILCTMAGDKLFSKKQRKLCKTLTKMYENNPDSPELAYALGKNLIFFKDYDDKAVIKGNEILSQLASRSFSDKLLNYKLRSNTFSNSYEL